MLLSFGMSSMPVSSDALAASLYSCVRRSPKVASLANGRSSYVLPAQTEEPAALAQLKAEPRHGVEQCRQPPAIRVKGGRGGRDTEELNSASAMVCRTLKSLERALMRQGRVSTRVLAMTCR